jgi:hypothetical protein
MLRTDQSKVPPTVPRVRRLPGDNMKARSVMTESEAFTAELCDGMLWMRWSQSTTVSDAMASALVERSDQLCPDVCPPMLVELNGMVTLTRGALHFFATRLNVAALALVGPSAVDRMISDFFTQVHRPPYPTRYFTTTDEARSWLTEHPHSA